MRWGWTQAGGGGYTADILFYAILYVTRIRYGDARCPRMYPLGENASVCTREIRGENASALVSLPVTHACPRRRGSHNAQGSYPSLLPPCPPPCPPLCSGPTLASRYLVPALVDCLERLATTAAASASYSITTPTPSRPRSPATESTASASTLAPENATSKVDGCKMLPGASAGRRRRRVWAGDCSGGDHASRALLRYCRRRGRVGDTGVRDSDAGAGGGAPFLLLSQALGDMCSRVRKRKWVA